ncbi:MAG: class I SAM-dependent methyltransferase [Candidatus Eisenbacteria bacterium]
MNDPKALVVEGYNRCAEAYAAARASSPADELVAFFERLSPGSSILDFGCGCGVPVGRFLAQSFEVTAVDISARQVALCRESVPRARVIHGDIMTQRFAPGSFDAVVLAGLEFAL